MDKLQNAYEVGKSDGRSRAYFGTVVTDPYLYLYFGKQMDAELSIEWHKGYRAGLIEGGFKPFKTLAAAEIMSKQDTVRRRLEGYARYCFECLSSDTKLMTRAEIISRRYEAMRMKWPAKAMALFQREMLCMLSPRIKRAIKTT